MVLKKEDGTLCLSDAYYYLLRLVDFDYRKDDAEYNSTDDAVNRAAYLKNAVNALKADYDNALSIYWVKEGADYYVTDDGGELQASDLSFGYYVFYEVKAPVGYDISNVYSETPADEDAAVLGPVEFRQTYTGADAGHQLVHNEQRKNARINILKTDEYGNPLNGAEYELYKKVPDGDPVKIVDAFTTGYDGMKADSILLDTSVYDWGTEFYFLETKSPNGYSNMENGSQKQIAFTLTREIAEEPIHIVRADDDRLKGKAELTKLAAKASGTVPAAAALEGAVFDLYLEDVVAPMRTDLTTDANGKLLLENLDWGDYYLLETQAPDGFRLPDTEAERRVYFSVGRGNCGDTAQQLTMENEPLKASLNIVKHIDDFNAAAWGNPTFIFRVTQTARYNGSEYTELSAAQQFTLTKNVVPVTPEANGYYGETGAFDIEPGIRS